MNQAKIIRFQSKQMYALIGLVLAGVLLAGASVIKRVDKQVFIDSFDECAQAGYPVMEGNPEQCRANGRTFVNR